MKIAKSLHPATRLMLAVAALVFLFLAAAPRANAAPTPDNKYEAPDKFGIRWANGPQVVNIGTIATIAVPAGQRYTDAAGAEIIDNMNHNPPSGELGILMPADAPGTWFISFSFEDIGYVPDTDKLDDAADDAMLQSVREGTEKANAARSAKGWPTMTVVGWDQKPFYDATTHHLTWAIRGRDSTGAEAVNYKSRVLGRRGVLSVMLVDDPGKIAAFVPTYNSLVTAITFNPGESYSEFRSGDKIAKYGLVGLITGGAAVAAFKLWKPLMAFGAVIVAGIAKFFRKIKNMIFGGNG